MKGRSRTSDVVREGALPVRARTLAAAAGGTLRAGAGRSGFTLIETIVAIAAVALVAVGLASIFDAVGKTVKGGKRVSLLNQYAGLVENQMRKDFSRMTRDGFLLLRHEWADADGDGRFDPNADAVPLHADDAAPRARRLDQILFFANGRFETARQPVHPDVRVSSGTAMIYYGHGQKRRQDSQRIDPTTGSPVADPLPYLQAKVDDNNGDDFTQREARLGVRPRTGSVDANPNFFPSQWTLVRHATLLSKPGSTAGVQVPGTLRFGADTLDPDDPADRRRLRDADYQIGLQPAARSVFRSLNRYYPSDVDGNLPDEADCFREPRRPSLTSGLVDIAATDLREIKSVIEGFGGYVPATGSNPAQLRRILPNVFNPASNPGLELDLLYYPWAWVDAGAAPSGGPSDLDMMHLWMQQALPGEGGGGPTFGATNAAARSVDPWGARMRVESQPVDMIASLSGEVRAPSRSPATETLAQQVALERMDQLMLAGNGFLPRCSEFIVEWSYGLVDSVRKETIWYGPAARFDSNRDGTVDTGDRFASLPYPFNVLSSTQAAEPQVVRVPRLPAQVLETPSAVPLPEQFLPDSARTWAHVVSSTLIYGYNRNDDTYAPSTTMLATTAHFGYVDPTFKQDQLEWNSASRTFTGGGDGIKDFGRQVDANSNGTIEVNEVRPGEPAATAIPWAWPKMIRVTMTLSDAQEPSIESTFQFVFSVPTDPPLNVQQ
jgi:prepilin-type N-terminal cleavage/methylation domain-containing protein